jgi:GT2 family glycosyltransferase
MNHRIAVSIVTYQSPIDEVMVAVQSALACPLVGHVCVVDNASGEPYATQLAQALPAGVVFLAAERNGGFGYGHNLALLQAPPTDYYLVLNPDVRVHPGALEALVAFLDAKPEAGLAVPKVLYEDGRLQPLNKRNPTVLDLVLRRVPEHIVARSPKMQARIAYFHMMDVGYDAPCQLEFASGCCMLFRRMILQRLGGFDERFFLYFEDTDITRRVNCISESWYCPDAVITHLWHRASAHSSKMFRVLLASAKHYFDKWGWVFW